MYPFSHNHGSVKNGCISNGIVKFAHFFAPFHGPLMGMGNVHLQVVPMWWLLGMLMPNPLATASSDKFLAPPALPKAVVRLNDGPKKLLSQQRKSGKRFV